MENQLIGKTIKNIQKKKHSEDCDSKNLLVLETEDGSIFHILGGYGSYTGNSCDEYLEVIEIEKIK